MASICEITNFWLVSATVTTSTMEALPMITPMDVSTARTLFARKASTATASASRMCIYLPKNSRSVFPELLQGLLRRLVLAVQFQRRLIFRPRSHRILPALLQPPQPVMSGPGARILGVHWRQLQVFPEEFFRLFRLLTLQNQRHAPVEFPPRIARSQILSGTGDRQKFLRILALQKIVADIINALGRFRFAFQSFGKFGIGIGVILFLRAADAGGVMPFGGVHLHQLLDQGLGLFFAAAHHSGRGAVILDQILLRIEIARVELHGRFELLLGLPRQGVSAQHGCVSRLRAK